VIVQVIEIQPFHSGWQVRGVQASASFPFFTGPSALERAIEYAWEGTARRAGEIRYCRGMVKLLAQRPSRKDREDVLRKTCPRLLPQLAGNVSRGLEVILEKLVN